jgi:hypothetical protein
MNCNCNFKKFMDLLPPFHLSVQAKRELNDPENALIGAFAGAITGAITTPLDVMKTRLMVQVDSFVSKSIHRITHHSFQPLLVSLTPYISLDRNRRDQRTSTPEL